MRVGGFVIGGMLGGVGGLALGLIIGIALFAGAGYFTTGGTPVPYDSNHNYITQHVSIRDTTDGVEMTCKLVLMGPAEFWPYKNMDVFTSGKSYTQSLWTFCCKNDIDVTMTIWGAGDDGKTYAFNFGRHGSNAIQITAFNNTYTWPKDGDIGYLDLTVTLS